MLKRFDYIQWLTEIPTIVRNFIYNKNVLLILGSEFSIDIRYPNPLFEYIISYSLAKTGRKRFLTMRICTTTSI